MYFADRELLQCIADVVLIVIEAVVQKHTFVFFKILRYWQLKFLPLIFTHFRQLDLLVKPIGLLLQNTGFSGK